MSQGLQHFHLFLLTGIISLCSGVSSFGQQVSSSSGPSEYQRPSAIQITVFEEAPEISVISWTYLRTLQSEEGEASLDFHSVRFLSSMRWDAQQLDTPGWFEDETGSFSVRVAADENPLAAWLTYYQIAPSVIANFQAEASRNPGAHLILETPFTRWSNLFNELTPDDHAFAAELHAHYQSSNLYFRPEVIKKPEPRETPLEYRILTPRELQSIREISRQIEEQEQLERQCDHDSLHKKLLPSEPVETSN